MKVALTFNAFTVEYVILIHQLPNQVNVLLYKKVKWVLVLRNVQMTTHVRASASVVVMVVATYVWLQFQVGILLAMLMALI